MDRISKVKAQCEQLSLSHQVTQFIVNEYQELDNWPNAHYYPDGKPSMGMGWTESFTNLGKVMGYDIDFRTPGDGESCEGYNEVAQVWDTFFSE